MKDCLIFELPLKNFYDGKYVNMEGISSGMIIVNDINDIRSLVHEMTHHLWHTKNEKLLNYLNFHGLNFKTKPFSRNKVLINSYKTHDIKENYPLEAWVDEAVAYFMEEMPHDMLWKLNIEEYRDIIAGAFSYCNKNGDVVFKGDNDVLIKDWDCFEDYYELFKKIGVI